MPRLSESEIRAILARAEDRDPRDRSQLTEDLAADLLEARAERDRYREALWEFQSAALAVVMKIGARDEIPLSAWAEWHRLEALLRPLTKELRTEPEPRAEERADG